MNENTTQIRYGTQRKRPTKDNLKSAPKSFNNKNQNCTTFKT